MRPTVRWPWTPAARSRSTAADHAAITAETYMAAAAKRTNNLGAGLLEQHDQRALERVPVHEQLRLAADQAGRAGARGRRLRRRERGRKVFQFMGTDRTVDLGIADYSDYELWKELSDTNVIPPAIASAAIKAFKLPTGTSKSFYAVVARNDVRAHAEVFVHGTMP